MASVGGIAVPAHPATRPGLGPTDHTAGCERRTRGRHGHSHEPGAGGLPALFVILQVDDWDLIVDGEERAGRVRPPGPPSMNRVRSTPAEGTQFTAGLAVGKSVVARVGV